MLLKIIKFPALHCKFHKMGILFPNQSAFKNAFTRTVHSGSHGNLKKYREFVYGFAIGCVGIMVASFSDFDNKLLNVNHIESTKNKYTFYAATLPSDKQKSRSPRAEFNFLADVVEKTQKSVVYIEVNARHPFNGQHIPISNGSGFIVKEDGLILTNAHVVNHYGQVIVKLYNGEQYYGAVESIDKESDLATVRIGAKNLPELPLGRSADVRPGEFVIAMGNPLTLSHTITAGVISSRSRKGNELGLHKKSDYIQTDAAINVGNSGGPLVNLDGQAIGINTMKVTEGISFAIPSDRAIEFLQQVEGNRKTSQWNKPEEAKQKRKFLGLTMLTLSPEVLKDLKERHADFPSVDSGVLVWRVMVHSPSYESGIRPGDVITSCNGAKVHNAEIIQKCLEEKTVLKLTVKRGQKTFEVTVHLVEPVMP